MEKPVKCCALDTNIIHQLNDLIYMVKHGMWHVICGKLAITIIINIIILLCVLAICGPFAHENGK